VLTIHTKPANKQAGNNSKHEKHMKLITIEQAREQGYTPLAGPYDASELWMLENVKADMQRGDIDAVIVNEMHKRIYGPSIWRK